MKTWKKVTLEAIADVENFKTARKEAGRNKEKRSYVKCVSEKDIEKLRQDVLSGNYKLSSPYCFKIKDKYSAKVRDIESPAFVDQILHHAIVQILEPYFLRSYHPHQMASIPNRGIEKGRKAIRKWAVHKRRTSKWVLQCDIKKYYDNINVETALAMLSKHIRDKRVISLLREVFSRTKNGSCGIPLGSYISQWLANFYISEILRQEELEFPRCHLMVYMDNIVFVAPSKKLCKNFLQWIVEKTESVGLEIKLTGKEMARIYTWSSKPINAVGYKSYKTGKQRVRSKIFLAIIKTLNKIDKVGYCCATQARSFISRYGFVFHSTSIFLIQKMQKAIEKYNMKLVAQIGLQI